MQNAINADALRRTARGRSATPDFRHRSGILSCRRLDPQARPWPKTPDRGFKVRKTMIRRLYDWTFSLAQSPHALWALAIVSFVESSFFPIPPDVLMIPMIIARPNRAFLIAGVCTLASVAGALLGYYIGAQLYASVAQPIFDFYGKMDDVELARLTFNEYGAWAVVVAGVTFLPFKVVTILSGAAGMSIPVFIVSSLFARALRFFLVALLLWKYGEPIRDFIEKRLGLMFALFCVLLVGSFFLVGYL